MMRLPLFRHFSPALALILVAAAAFVVLNEKTAQATDEPPPPAATSEPAPHPLSRLVVLGGSASSGLSARLTTKIDDVRRSHTFNLAEVLNLMLVDPSRKAAGHTDAFFFKHPVRSAEMQAYQARKSKASVVIALDYLFWFVFEDVKSSGDPKELLAARMASLDQGFERLSSISPDIVLIVSDIPDMAPAVGGRTSMLPPERMPLPQSVSVLNDQLADWALIRGNVIILPMAEFMSAAHTGQSVKVGDVVWPPGWPLLQQDRMHPTADGLVALNQMVAAAMIESFDEVTAADFELGTNEIRLAMQAVLAATKPIERQKTPTNPNLGAGRGTGGG